MIRAVIHIYFLSNLILRHLNRKDKVLQWYYLGFATIVYYCNSTIKIGKYKYEQNKTIKQTHRCKTFTIYLKMK